MAGHDILITGVNGFIASHLAERLLQQNVSVRGTARRPASADWLAERGVDILPADLSDRGRAQPRCVRLPICRSRRGLDWRLRVAAGDWVTGSMSTEPPTFLLQLRRPASNASYTSAVWPCTGETARR